jgi:2-hydroxy-3-keto-5-methylthiopentenyl-1-phosphate phosphatase
VLSVRGVAIPVLSNPGHWGGPGAAVSGLTMGTRTNSPFFSPQDGIDKAGVVASAVASGRVVAFAGDGRPDLNAALCVGPDWRFATGWLAGELTRRGERFTRFSLWPEVVERLVM